MNESSNAPAIIAMAVALLGIVGNLCMIFVLFRMGGIAKRLDEIVKQLKVNDKHRREEFESLPE